MNAKRTLAILLTVVMALGCFAGFTFTSAAESITLTDYATFTWGGGEGTTKVPTMNDGNVGGYFDLGYWSDDVANPAYGTAGTCYIEADLGTLCTIETLSAWTLTGRNYKWDAYITADNTADISTWTKVEGKTNDDECTSDGYTVTLETPVEGRYIRFYGMYNNANVGFHFTELQATGSWKDANANLPLTAPKEPTTTTTITVGPSAFGQWENWSEKTNALVGITAGENGVLNTLLMDGLKNGDYTLKITLTDETADKTYIIPQYFFDSPTIEFYAASPHFFRFAFTEYNIPLVVGNAYTIQLDVYKGEKLLFTGATTEGQFSDWSNAPELIINEVPHDYVEPGEEPDVPVEPTIPELTIAPYVYTSAGIAGFENWPAADKQTNLLVKAPKATGDFRNNTWVLTINGTEYTMTVASTGAAGDYYIYRFQVCLAETPFIPVVGTEYTISAKIYDGETLVATTTESAGFIPHEEPIVPTTPDPEPTEPTKITISGYDPDALKGFQNWDGGNGMQTQLLICTTEDVNMAYTWKLTITDGETTKVVTLKAATGYDTWLRRFEPVLGEGENQFIPVQGTEYTISAEIYNEAGELVMVADAASGFVCGEEPIVPSVEPPQTGDAAVYATIAVAVAAVALAVVFKKRATI